MSDDKPGIERRGVLIGLGVAAVGAAVAAPSIINKTKGEVASAQDAPDYYPPTRTGMRGSHPGSFENAHALRDGTLRIEHAEAVDEPYDLVIVGGGISGLSAAHFYRAARPGAKILIVDNHDDFGGHAKRNEFHVDGHLLLLNGGTMLIDSPRPYSAVASGLLGQLGIDPVGLSKAHAVAPRVANAKLREGVFFDSETYGRDHLAVLPDSASTTAETFAAALRDAPLNDQAKRDIARLETAKIDYLPELTTVQTMDRLSRVSYAAFLTDIAKVDPQVVGYYQKSTHGEFGSGIDDEPALDCWGIGLPGFAGMKLDHKITSRMGNTAAGYSNAGGSATFHFPDGNATVARALVRDLVPAIAPAGSIENLVGAKVDYRTLDEPGQPVRIRLNSLAVRVQPRGPGVDVTYVEAGAIKRVSATHCVLACYNMIIPYLLLELPEKQKAALHELVKIPLVYTSVALRNWRAFDRLGVNAVSCPGSYFANFRLFPGPEIGASTGPRTPDDPIMVHMLRTPCLPGAPTERDQHRAGRMELLGTSIETFEGHVRDQLGRSLKGGGFDPQRDIAAIIVNRWPHGYAYEYNPLYDPWDIPESEQPHVVGRQRFGPITIANSDSGAAAYTDSAIDQAHRAVSELLSA
ncbi:MAG: NAD(P)-binding protein [Sphingomicrobium sp.]